MMKFAVSSKGNDVSDSLKSKIQTYLLDFGLECDEEEPDIVISVGGDGTLYTHFTNTAAASTKRLLSGFIQDISAFMPTGCRPRLKKLVIAIAKTPYQIVEYPVLEVIVRYNDGSDEARYLALNECTIKSIEGTLVTDVEIKGELFETFRGDGLCLSTPSGSTAYNKALGGAIIHPSIRAVQLAEMASINNRVFRTVGSPLILPEHHTCLIKPINDVTFQVAIDHLTLLHKDVKSIQCRVANENIRFARFRPFPFWKRVQDSFIGKGE